MRVSGLGCIDLAYGCSRMVRHESRLVSFRPGEQEGAENRTMALIVQGIGLRPETLTLAVTGFVLAIPWLAVRSRPQWLVLDVCHPAAALRPCVPRRYLR